MSANENIATCLRACFYNVQVSQINWLIPVNAGYLPWKVSDWELFQNSPALLPMEILHFLALFTLFVPS